MNPIGYIYIYIYIYCVYYITSNVLLKRVSHYKYFRKLAGNIATLKPFSIKLYRDTPYKVTILQVSCRNVRGYPTTIVVNLIETRFKVTIFPASSDGIPPL